MKLSEPRQAYVQIWKQLTGNSVTWEAAHKLLQARFVETNAKRGMTLLLVDEVFKKKMSNHHFTHKERTRNNLSCLSARSPVQQTSRRGLQSFGLAEQIERQIGRSHDSEHDGSSGKDPNGQSHVAPWPDQVDVSTLQLQAARGNRRVQAQGFQCVFR